MSSLGPMALSGLFYFWLLQDSLMRGNALPLLHQLADWQRQQAQHGQQPGGTAGSGGGSSGPLMRAAIANAVGALVEARMERFPLVGNYDVHTV